MAGEARRKGQEGSRWVNERPSGEDIASWFESNVPMHEGLSPAEYLPGIVLIPNKEKAKEVVGFNDDGLPRIMELESLIYTPYAKVETRVKYFHDLMQKNPDWLGVVEPVAPAQQDPRLPVGFFPYAVEGERGVTRYICCSMKVTVYERGTVEMKPVVIDKRTGSTKMVRTGKTVIDAPPATKMIAALGRYGPDPFALMKAETGAVGRALGLAGMLTIPGTGVATAEDLQEAQALEGQASVEQPVAPPAPVKVDPEAVLTALRTEAAEAVTKLKDGYPGRFAEFQVWAKGRQYGRIAEIQDETKLRGLITKATKMEQEGADEGDIPTPEPEPETAD